MQFVRQRGVRYVGALLLLALLWLPLVLGGHRHQPTDLDASRTKCAICAVTAHAPAHFAPAPPALALPLLGEVAAPETVPPATRIELLARAPRAPPACGTIVA